MSLWLAVALTLLGSGLMNLGIVLMKVGALEVPSERRARVGVVGAYAGSPKSWLGLAINFAGAGLFLAAISARAAPVSLLQPLATFGLVVNALLAVVWLRERFNRGEWLGVALLFLGVVLVGASAQTPAGEPTLHHQSLPYFLAVILVLAGGAFVWLMRGRDHLLVEVLYGLLAGLLLGLGYFDAKTSALAWRQAGGGIAALYTILMVGGLVGGFLTLLKGYYQGRVVIVKSTSFVINQVVVGVGGIYCLSEGFPQQTLALSARLGGYALILGGFCMFAACRAPSA